MVMQQSAIQFQQSQANTNALFAQQAVMAQRSQAMTAGNFSALGQLDMASSQIAQEQASSNAAAQQAISQTNLQHQAQQAAIQQSNMAAMTEFSRVADSAIYSAGMSDGETGRSWSGSNVLTEPGSSESSPTSDASWFDPSDGGSDWLDSSSGGGSAEFGSAFTNPGSHDDHDDHHVPGMPDGYFGPDEGPSRKVPTLKVGTSKVPTLHLGNGGGGPSQDMIEFRDVIGRATFDGINEQTGNPDYAYKFDNFTVKVTDENLDKGSIGIVNDIYRVGRLEQQMFQNFSLPEGATVQITPYDMWNIYTVPGICDTCSDATVARGAKSYIDPETGETKRGPGAAYQSATNTIVVRQGFGEQIFQHETGHAVDDQIVRAPGNEALAALVARGWAKVDGNPVYFQQDGSKSYAQKSSGEAFAESFSTAFSPSRNDRGFYRGLVVDMKTMNQENPDMAKAVSGIIGGYYKVDAAGSGSGLGRGEEPSFLGFGASGAGGGGYSSLSYNNSIASLKTFGSSFDSFGSVLTKLGATTIPNYGGEGIQAVVLAKNDLVGASVQAQASYNPWARDAEAKALDLALRGIGVGKAGLAAVELQGNVTADQAISCVDAGAIQSSQNAGLFRFHMESTGEHFITSNLQEGCSVGFKFEKVAFKLLDKAEGMKPLYRCWTKQNHFISDRADCEGHNVEGLMGYASAKPAAGLVPLHRGLHAIGDVLATIDKAELDLNKYQYQGVLGYVLPPGASTQVASK